MLQVMKTSIATLHCFYYTTHASSSSYHSIPRQQLGWGEGGRRLAAAAQVLIFPPAATTSQALHSPTQASNPSVEHSTSQRLCNDKQLLRYTWHSTNSVHSSFKVQLEQHFSLSSYFATKQCGIINSSPVILA